MQTVNDLGQLRARSRRLSQTILVVLVVWAAAIVGPTLVGFFSLERYGYSIWPALVRTIVLFSPTIAYLCGLAAIRVAFRDFAVGGAFGVSMSRACTRAGLALTAGAALSAIVVPNIMRVLKQSPVFERMGGASGAYAFDAAYLAISLVGLALMLLGGLLNRASELQTEAAHLNSELKTFF